MHVTWVALGARCLEGLRALLADARLEAEGEDAVVAEASPAPLDAPVPHTAAQRVARLVACAPLHQVSDPLYTLT